MVTRVIVYEDNEMMRQALAKLLLQDPTYQLVGSFSSCEDITTHMKSLEPTVILMDIELPGISGIEGIRKLRSMKSEVKVIVLTVFEDNQNVFDAICAGANGYLLKKSVFEKLFESINEVLAGGSPMSSSIASKVLKLLAGSRLNYTKNDYRLTEREKEILQSLVKGNSYKMIATDLSISQETVKTHLKRVYEKLQVHSQTEAVAKAINEKLV